MSACDDGAEARVTNDSLLTFGLCLVYSFIYMLYLYTTQSQHPPPPGRGPQCEDQHAIPAPWPVWVLEPHRGSQRHSGVTPKQASARESGPRRLRQPIRAERSLRERQRGGGCRLVPANGAFRWLLKQPFISRLSRAPLTPG